MVSEAKLSRLLEEQGYKLHEFLGEGGSGKVYSCWQRKESGELKKTLVAIKTLNPNAPLDLKEKFEREADILEDYMHEGLARGRKFIEGDMKHHIMDYISGNNLKELMETDRALPLEFSSAVVYKIGRVLEYLHNHPLDRVINRDIKPDNIMISEDGKVYLLDFNIAKIGSESDKLDFSFAGTPSYMSPEQIGKKETTPKTDLWGLGVTFYEALTGKLPFRHNDDPTKTSEAEDYRKLMLKERVKGRYKSPRGLNKELSTFRNLISLKPWRALKPLRIPKMIRKLLGGKKFLGITVIKPYRDISAFNHDLERILKLDDKKADTIIDDYVSSRFIFGYLGYNPDIEDSYFEYPKYRPSAQL